VTGPRVPFYGWVVVAASFVVTACLGEVQWSFGVFFKALENEFGWSRGLTSTGYTFLAVGYAISSVAFGRLADRYPPRLILLVSALLSGTSIALCSRIETVLQLQALLFATGLGAGALIPVPTATVSRWFQNRPGGAIALGVTMAGVGMGAIVFAPLFSRLILTFDWRKSFLIAGAMYFIFVSVAAVLMKPSPSSPMRQARSMNAPSAAPVSRGRLFRAPQFVQVVAIMVVTTLSFQTVTVHLVPHAVDVGISQTAAAAALGFAGACSVPGRLGSGFLSERLGWGRTLVLSQAGMAIGMLALPFIAGEFPLFAVVGLYGLCQGIRAVSVIGVLGHVFGMRAVGELTGVMIAAAHGTGALGPYLAGFFFDRWGSYTAIFIALGVAIMVGAVLSLRLDVEPQAEPPL